MPLDSKVVPVFMLSWLTFFNSAIAINRVTEKGSCNVNRIIEKKLATLIGLS